MSDSVRVIHGDCLEILPTLAGEPIAAVVTDPPYGIGFDYGGTREATDNPGDYWNWLRPRYQGAFDLLEPGGLVAIWQAQLNFPYFWEWFGQDIRIYAACKNFIQVRPTPIQYGYDPVVMFYKPGAKPLSPPKPARSLDWSIGDTANTRARRLTKGHPCPRPLGQVREILENFAAPEGLILDPFAGSGTTGVAALKTGRRAILIERDPRYIPIIHRRLAEAATPLFDAQEAES